MSPDDEDATSSVATALEDPPSDPPADLSSDDALPSPLPDEETPPEKTATEQHVDSLMALPADERQALLSAQEKALEEAGETTPWAKRQDDATSEATRIASQVQERDRRQGEVRTWESNRNAARANVKWIVNDLGGQWEKRGIDEPAPRHDDGELDKQLDAYADAAGGLRSHAAITEIGNAMTDGIEPYGGPITDAELGRIERAAGRGAKVHEYQAILADRVRKDVTAEMDKDIEKRIRDAVAAERGAITADAMRDVKTTPEASAASATTGPKQPTYAEYDEATSDQRAEWKRDGIEAVATE
jgi:hypothetical protein